MRVCTVLLTHLWYHKSTAQSNDFNPPARSRAAAAPTDCSAGFGAWAGGAGALSPPDLEQPGEEEKRGHVQADWGLMIKRRVAVKMLRLT